MNLTNAAGFTSGLIFLGLAAALLVLIVLYAPRLRRRKDQYIDRSGGPLPLPIENENQAGEATGYPQDERLSSRPACLAPNEERPVRFQEVRPEPDDDDYDEMYCDDDD